MRFDRWIARRYGLYVFVGTLVLPVAMRPIHVPLALTALLIATTAGSAAEIGDAAAPLKIAEWVKGRPVNLAEARGKQIVVVEFWATWCPPCRTTIPHLTALQKKYRDQGVVFVGVSDEKPEIVRAFVGKMGAQMDYVVAVDEARQTSKGYLEAYGATGIPHAFVLDKEGRVVWQGHPLTDLDVILERLVAGKLDIAMARKRARGEQLIQDFYRAVQAGKGVDTTGPLIQEIQSLEREIGGLAQGKPFDPEAARRQVQFQAALRSYQSALFGGKPEEEVASLEKEAARLAPPDADFPNLNANLKLQALFTRYARALSSGEAAAEELGRQVVAAPSRNYQLLNEMAWALLTDDSFKRRDLPVALRLARRAYDACDGKEPAVVDTYARALFDSGDVKQALEYQRKALALATDPEVRQQIEDSLRRYEAQARTLGLKP